MDKSLILRRSTDLEQDTEAKRITRLLQKWGAYVYYEAKTGSVYVKFPHWGLGSIRIANHDGIPKYAYRWNLTLHREYQWRFEDDRGVYRLYFGIERLDDFIREFESQAKDRNIKPGDIEAYEDYKGKKRKISSEVDPSPHYGHMEDKMVKRSHQPPQLITRRLK